MYQLNSIGGACPTQAEGLTERGRNFYFRYRSGRWTLKVAYGDAVSGDLIASGTVGDSLDGYMSNTDVLSILNGYLEGW